MSRIGVIGAGAFGTALAAALAADGSQITLWLRDAAQAGHINRHRKNVARLPGIRLPDTITATSALADLAGVEALLLVLPAQATSAFLDRHHTQLPGVPLILCAKGITREGHRLQSELVPAGHDVCVLTGPGFAAEIASGKPTALTLASRTNKLKSLQNQLSRPALRLYRSTDIIGAQLGGALKNVIAIAAGIAVGAGLGESARAAILTRGFAEMRDLARAMGAEDHTLTGLSGFGDLVLTCTSEKSRNFTHGLLLGREADTPAATVEGIATARAAVELSRKYGVEMPISEAVAHILERKSAINEALEALLARPLRAE